MRTRLLIAPLAACLLLTACGADDSAGAGEPEPAPTDEVNEDADFDRDQQEADARALLGLPEDEVEEDTDTRIVRRGDEQFPVTMDLRPGRQNVELEDDGSGTFVVTRVIVEAPGDQESIVVE